MFNRNDHSFVICAYKDNPAFRNDNTIFIESNSKE